MKPKDHAGGSWSRQVRNAGGVDQCFSSGDDEEHSSPYLFRRQSCPDVLPDGMLEKERTGMSPKCVDSAAICWEVPVRVEGK